jgi:hypothetical protein
MIMDAFELLARWGRSRHPCDITDRPGRTTELPATDDLEEAAGPSGHRQADQR